MRGRIWAMWITQTLEGLMCILMGAVTYGQYHNPHTSPDGMVRPPCDRAIAHRGCRHAAAAAAVAAATSAAAVAHACLASRMPQVPGTWTTTVASMSNGVIIPTEVRRRGTPSVGCARPRHGRLQTVGGV